MLNKLAEVKPNVRLWYRDEGQFQQALQAGEIPMGQYYHDVTGLAAAQGQPVRSTFPRRAGCSTRAPGACPRRRRPWTEAHVFIDYMCRPDIQAEAVAQGRHRADRQARPARSDGRGVRRGREQTSRRSFRATTCTSSGMTGSIRSGPR